MTKPRLQTLFDQIGANTIDELVKAFYPKVYADQSLSPLFEENMNEIMRKQRMFLTQFLGGPPAMRHRHLPFEITPDRAHSWLRCMKEAFEEVGLNDHPAEDMFFSRLTQVAANMVNTEKND
ncbi:globin [Lederbergia citrea]|uniref:globin domain-containing protein n=1 Tax=Lederbergia citrea TaxID=2833581 RepID=UPI001BC9C5CF|nr:globin [Lederbergia citrea]